MLYNLIIIGAGPAGLMAAFRASDFDKNILVIEKNNIAGQKLLITGNGQCNFTNVLSKDLFLKKYFEAENFLKSSFYSFSNTDAISFFKKRGVDCFIRDDGNVFPKSMKSTTIRNCFLEELNKKNIPILFNKEVNKITKMNNDIFSVQTKNENFETKNIILACGGKSYPSTGATGDGYQFAKDFGHKIIPPVCALVPLKSNDPVCKELTGISVLDKKIILMRNGKKIYSIKGDVLFTHFGLSGPAILNISRFVESKDIINISLYNDSNEELFKLNFLSDLNNNPKKLLKNLLYEFISPKRLSDYIFKIACNNEEIRACETSKILRQTLIKLISNFSITIENCLGFEKAMVTRGGVDLKEVNSKTLESKIIKNLYFAGEILDIDGETGGYNIQIALSLGYLAASSCCDNNK